MYEKWILIDFHNFIFRYFFANKRNIDENGFIFLKYLILKNIFNMIHQQLPQKVILAFDSKHSWRKQYYPLYKKNRKEQREKSDIDYKKFFDFIINFRKELSKTFPFYCLFLKYCEADDIIAALTIDDNGLCKKIVISSDSDFIQLLDNSNISVFDPLKNKFIESDIPQEILQMKILSGDRGDNVPSVMYSYENNELKFLREKAEKYSCSRGLGEKTAEKIVNDKNRMKEMLLDDDILKNFKRNNVLINFKKIPLKLREKIRENFDKYILPNDVKIFDYFKENKFREFIEQYSDIKSLLNNLS